MYKSVLEDLRYEIEEYNLDMSGLEQLSREVRDHFFKYIDL